MPSPDKIEVFHKILREAAHADVPVHETPSYSQITDEDILAFEEIQKIWELSKNYSTPEQTFDKDKAFQSFLQKINNETPATQPLTKVPESNQAQDEKIRKLSFSPKLLLRYAAVVVALFIATYFFIQRPETISTGQAGLYVTLQDGSHIWLDKNSSVTIHKFSGKNRKVDITGRAYFDVTKNESAPFSIKTKDFDVTVLGTSFVVDQNASEVDVISGVVKVSTKNNDVTLQKKEKVSVKNGTTNKSVSSGVLPSWANPELSFDNTPLDKVVADLSAFYRVHIELEQQMDWSLCPFTTTGSLAKTSLEDVFTLLALSYDCKAVKKDDTHYMITGVNCR